MSARMFCDCIKDATTQGVHVPTALGNSQNRIEAKRRAAARRGMDMSGMDKSWKLPFEIKKYDAEQQLIFGWASVVEKDGVAVIDKQGDIIPIDELENAAYEFCLYSRAQGDMHKRSVAKATQVGRLVESMVFTHEKQEALGIDLGMVGWWTGFKVDDPAVWAAHKRGERPEFSIGGMCISEEVDKADVGGRKFNRFPFDQGAAAAVHHSIVRLFANQRQALLHEYANYRAGVAKAGASDRTGRFVAVVDEDDNTLQNTVRAVGENIARAGQRTGQDGVNQMVGNPNRLLKPEEQARLRAMSMPLADNIDFWTRKYGKERAAELVGRQYNSRGQLVVRPDAEWNINGTTNEAVSRLVDQAIKRDWDVDKLADKLEATGLFSDLRAETIARTEISRAQNAAILKAGYEYQRQFKVKLKKVWLLGPNPCPICSENEGDVLTLNAEFTSGHFAPPVHPNCMCEVVLFEEEVSRPSRRRKGILKWRKSSVDFGLMKSQVSIAAPARVSRLC